MPAACTSSRIRKNLQYKCPQRTADHTWGSAATAAGGASTQLSGKQRQDAAARHAERLALLQGGVRRQLVVGSNGGWRQVDVGRDTVNGRAWASCDHVTARRRICDSISLAKLQVHWVTASSLCPSCKPCNLLSIQSTRCHHADNRSRRTDLLAVQGPALLPPAQLSAGSSLGTAGPAGSAFHLLFRDLVLSLRIRTPA